MSPRQAYVGVISAISLMLIACTADTSVAVVRSQQLGSHNDDTGTYKDETEKFIEDDDGEMAQALDKVFTDAECDEPESIEVGTAYACTAVDEEGTTYVFDAEIDGEDSFIVQAGVAQQD